MPLVDHLEELRQRVLRSLIAIIIGSILSFFFIKDIVQLLEAPAGKIHFLQLAPGEFLFVSIKVAGYSGLIISLPFIIYQLLRFIFPGLTNKEKKLIAPTVAGSAILFFIGLYFALNILIPAALKFLISYGADVVEPIWSIERYLDFVLLIMISTGLAFQLPILQFILGSLGLIKWRKMLSSWRWVVLSAAIAGAVLTPSTDPITMLLLTTAITGLFLIGVALVALTEQFKERTPSISRPPSTAD
tara:strand:- start:1735 stop:2469 length:735 start_codon:yes stop_codon:yes gene_type:complete